MNKDFGEFQKKALHETDSFFPIFFVDPITTRIAYLLRNSNVRPNYITAIRLFIIFPLLLFSLFLAPILKLDWMYLVSAIIFYFVFVTDSLDGQLARGLDRKSSRGAFLDSIADRVCAMIFFVSIFSIGMYLEDLFLIYGAFFLVILKSVHMMIITKIYYHKDSLNENLFSGESALNKMKLLKLFSYVDSIGFKLRIKRFRTFFGGYERYVIVIILPMIFLFFGFNPVVLVIEYALLVLYSVFFIIRINSLLRRY